MDVKECERATDGNDAVSAPVSNIVTVKLTSSISPSTKFSDGAFYKARFVPNYVRSLTERKILRILLL